MFEIIYKLPSEYYFQLVKNQQTEEDIYYILLKQKQYFLHFYKTSQFIKLPLKWQISQKVVHIQI